MSFNAITDAVTELDLIFGDEPDLPCASRSVVHRRHGVGAVRYLAHQHCPGCGRHDRGWVCEGCASWARSSTECTHYTGGCMYTAPVRDFFVSIEAAR